MELLLSTYPFGCVALLNGIYYDWIKLHKRGIDEKCFEFHHNGLPFKNPSLDDILKLTNKVDALYLYVCNSSQQPFSSLYIYCFSP